MCGIGPVGEVLHIRPRPAGGGSAESCGNVPAFNTVEILPCAEGSALHMGDRPLKTDVLGRVAESCGKHGIRLRGRPFRMCSTPATGPRRPCTVREGPRREAGPAWTPRAGGHVRGARGGPVDRGPDPAGGGAWPAPLKPGERTSALAPAGGAAVGRDMQDVVPESRRVSAAAAAGRDARDVVDDGADAGERGEWPGHADRGADAGERGEQGEWPGHADRGADAGERGEQGEWPGHADRGADARESVMLVTESFRRLPRGTRRKPPSALVAEGATTTTCCGRG